MTTKVRVQSISGQVVDLFKREIFHGTVEWSGGRITAVRRDPRVKDKRLIMPGLVDAHIHIESSLLPPSEFARLAVIHGTVATVSDPHEIANVLGEAGVLYMLADAKRSPLKFNFGAPSCVPATTFETAGAKLDSKAVARLLARKDVRYLAEVMNFPGVLGRDPELMAMIAAAKTEEKQVDGHAPGLRGAQAKAYADAGPTTDHECFTIEEAQDKLAAGMKILIREGSAARNFEALKPLLKTHPQSCMFCCDDLHPDLLVKRHLDEHVRRALATGANKFDVLRAASVNPVEHYGLKVGLLRVGEEADFIVVDGWKKFRVERTYIDGALVASGGRTRLKRLAPKLANKFKARAVKAADFAVKTVGSTLNVIEALNGQLVTKHLTLPATDIGVKRDVLKIAVVNRYATKAPVAVGYIRGFGLKAGALASSVAHDSHNIVAVGVDDASLAAAVNLVIAEKGGLSVVGPRMKAVLPLPIAGLMSALDGREAARRYTRLDRTSKKLGSKLDAPFMTLSFMALLVIPDLKLSDRGLFSATKWGFVPVSE
ncbi:adenine deaminase [Rariglobus hedericola]|uniref:Adenine deaminase n=1 Tax=Rariglobus hedericola TaxID=2597822 RepID=A0A556QL55_9BACT|nr:adenine deaminase [Rariglobus hedericola]TSJ77390.1 adenine deaminase [Rariglobus hedericola]